MAQVSESAVVAASVDDVYGAWTRPGELSRWYADRVVGEVAAGAELEFHFDALGVAARVQVVDLLPPTRLGWVAEVGEVDQPVTVELLPDAFGCRVRVSHRGLGDADEAAGTRSGWTLRLAVLREYLEHHAGCDRISFAVLGLAPASAAAVFDALVAPTFLGIDGAEEGEPWSANLGGKHLSGTVLAVSPGRELAVSCDAIGGVLVFRSLPAAGARLVGVEAMSWRMGEPALAATRTGLEAAVNELVTRLGGRPEHLA